MNLGRTWRIRERATFNLRIEFTNVFNRAFVNDPANTNAKAARKFAPNGNTTGGFGSINATSSTAFPVAAVNLQPRTDTMVARITF